MKVPQILTSWLVGIFTGKAVVPAVHVTRCPPGVAEGSSISWQGVGGTDPIKYLG